MRDLRIIIPLLAAVLLAAGLPVLYGLRPGQESSPPKLELPAGEKACVMPADYMRQSHMTLLRQWRESVVRTGDRTPVSAGGKTYEKSLSGTCFKCHAKKSAFCDRCHASLGAAPACWDCHHYTEEVAHGAE
ncbi:MAG TPA: sulfate reduction electron transfer complex DsrMKJOP subunit DsrJ [Spirochaetota bacterium]|nr:sulfate reduction electron transfer complex DsrMKJOP subunit DsrJ [Spirochaetota bacterium]HOD14400.1 sulfate reduction electron transfer complex DsrMKJOP subunit DsrJ [Spirochaetota bacterium]HPG50049.1 sulfate reduction electron transfer complex DsrMKJOP subunit DsrJ [Spirochaetota bacterium]HPN13258.1 sulfate reduction electron transfer complex DsrMKJOP subunit DsrJ [Spirochaetota bacterium]HQL81258.1 sulfate reduction electron transfer complex DsrMKJOP subunit DsrJ [Spirochaetota bacteri